MRSRAPIWDNRIAYQPAPLVLVGRGGSGLQVQWSHVNVWAQMPGYFFDGEWTRLQVRWRVGLTEATELTLDAGLLARSGGRLDGAIEGFHRAFGLTQSRRDRYPRDRLRVARQGADGTFAAALVDQDAGVGLARPALGLRRSLWRGEGGRHLVGELTLGLPLGGVRRQFAAPGAELAASVAAGAPLLGPLALAAACGATTRFGGGETYGMPLGAVQKHLFLGLTYALGRRWQLALQYLNQDGAVESPRYAPLDRTTHEFALGVRALVGRRWSFEVAVLENTVHDANTPDVGLAFGVGLVDPRNGK